MKKLRIVYTVIFCTILFTEIFIALFVHDSFVRPYIGDVLVTTLICCFCRIIIPNGVRALPIYVFAFATVVEVAQYFDIVKLFGMEENKFISVIIGRTFSFGDLICYAAGCAVFFVVDYVIKKHLLLLITHS